MKAIILGAGELGRGLASILSENKHDVVLVDAQQDLLERLSRRLDVMPIHGDCGAIQVLKEAGIDNCDLLIASSGDDAANILACQVANHFKVKSSICRLTSDSFFSDVDGFSSESLGITHKVIPDDECVQKITDVLENQIVLEKILFSHPNAVMTAIAIHKDSPLNNVALKNFPVPELLAQVRICGIIRDRQLLVPTGDTKIEAGDEVYFSGPKKGVQKTVDWASPRDAKIKQICVAGASRIGQKVAMQLQNAGKSVRLIEKDATVAEVFLNHNKTDLMVINGDPTDAEILIEAGVEACDAFVSVQEDDEDNILTCALAKKKGARKVVAVTTRADYVDVVPDIEMIDCSYSANTVAVNTVLRHVNMRDGVQNVNAILHRTNAYVYEFTIGPKSLACNRRIDECRQHAQAIIALVFRGDKVLAPSGDMELLEGDVAATIATPRTVEAIHKLFAEK